MPTPIQNNVNLAQATHTYPDNGLFTVTVTVADGPPGSTTLAQSLVTVRNLSPVAANKLNNTNANVLLQFAQAFLLQGATEPNAGNDPLSLINVAPQSRLGATVTPLGNGQFQYDPNASAELVALKRSSVGRTST